MDAKQRLDQLRAGFTREIDSRIALIEATVGSPIEASVVVEMCAYLDSTEMPNVDSSPSSFPCGNGDEWAVCMWTDFCGEETRVWLQPRIHHRSGLVYTPDLGVEIDRGTGWGVVRVAVECDGHDFHEKTKQQAARDKSRDRDLMECGWPVLRYTGSEIYRDARLVVRNIFDVLNQKRQELDKHIEESRGRGK